MAAPFNPKARLWVRGRKDIFRRMAEVVGPDDEVAWLHAASLGEFEQGRPGDRGAPRGMSPIQDSADVLFSVGLRSARKTLPAPTGYSTLPADTPRNARRLRRVSPGESGRFRQVRVLDQRPARDAKGGNAPLPDFVDFPARRDIFRPYGGLFRRALGAFSHIFVQNDESRALLGRIGVRCVSVTGDTRFDRVCSIAARAERIA